MRKHEKIRRQRDLARDFMKEMIYLSLEFPAKIIDQV